MVVLAALTTTSLFAQKVQVEFDPNIDFSKLTTFAIGEARVESDEASLKRDSIRTRITLEIQKSLEAKGLTLATNGTPSLKVVYLLSSAVKTRVQESPIGRRGTVQSISKVPYLVGTLTIGFRTAQSLAWRAIARVEDVSIEGKLDDMVKKSIDQYPPKPK